jgi:dTDP-4-amino-4,6-dideoxygalactose transaminase
MGAVTRVLESQHFILGAEVAAFENEVGKYLGTKFAIGCASGTQAALLSSDRRRSLDKTAKLESTERTFGGGR